LIIKINFTKLLIFSKSRISYFILFKDGLDVLEDFKEIIVLVGGTRSSRVVVIPLRPWHGYPSFPTFSRISQQPSRSNRDAALDSSYKDREVSQHQEQLSNSIAIQLWMMILAILAKRLS